MALTFPAAYHNRNVIFSLSVYIALMWSIDFFLSFSFLSYNAVTSVSSESDSAVVLNVGLIGSGASTPIIGQ